MKGRSQMRSGPPICRCSRRSILQTHTLQEAAARGIDVPAQVAAQLMGDSSLYLSPVEDPRTAFQL